MTEEQVLIKIKKLLALATSDNPNEAANAAAAAQTLLLRHNISQAQLNEFSIEKNEKVVQVTTAGKNKHNRTKWQDSLVGRVAKANLCDVLLSNNTTGYVWIGKKTNIEVGQYIFEMLCNDLMRLCEAAFKYLKAEGMISAHGKRWSNSFYFGAVQTIGERLHTNLLELKDVEPGANDMIVLNDVEIESYMKVHYPRLTHSAISFTRERGAFEAGKQAGRMVQFRQGIGAGGSLAPRQLNKG